jgi:hypothetical protein
MPLYTVNPRFTNPRDVLLAIQRALVDGLADILADDQIIISDPDEWDNGTPEPMLSGPFLTLCLSDSDFPDDVQIGGGQLACEELAAVNITIFSNERLSQTGHMPEAVYDIDQGLLEIKRRVLRVLVWADPLGDNALPLLSQLIPARSSSKPRKNAEGIWFLSLTFGASFFWDLT